jgi:hypothetical protein
MNYIDAGYGIALTVLSAYSVSLWYRRRRLERLAAAVRAQAAASASAVEPVGAPIGERVPAPVEA